MGGFSSMRLNLKLTSIVKELMVDLGLNPSGEGNRSKYPLTDITQSYMQSPISYFI